MLTRKGLQFSFVFFPLLIIFLLAFSVAAISSEREKIIETFADLRPSVGALYAQEEGGDMRFLCSATAVDRYEGKTVILTAYHCLRKGVAYLINFGDNKFRSLKVWKIPHYEVNRQKHPRKYNEPETDMALFLMEGEDVPIVPLAKTSDAEPGTKLTMVGYPLGQAKISYEGSVAGRFDRLGSDLYDYLLVQIFAAPGSSGSSVVNVDTGEVMAVLVAAKSGGGLPVIFATPVEYMKHLMHVRPENGKDVGAEPEKEAPSLPEEKSIP